jgi:hypothetical protein
MNIKCGTSSFLCDFFLCILSNKARGKLNLDSNWTMDVNQYILKCG